MCAHPNHSLARSRRSQGVATGAGVTGRSCDRPGLLPSANRAMLRKGPSCPRSVEAGGSVPARRRVPSNLCKAFDVLLLWLQRRRERRQLGALSDHMLKDLGVTRADIDVETRKMFWRR